MKLKKEVKAIIIISLAILITIPTYRLLRKEKQKEQTNETIEIPNKKEEKKQVKLTFVGDLLFETPYYNAIQNGESKDLYFSKVKKYFEEDDITVGNMEVVIGNDTLTTSGSGYNFCAPSWIGDLVKEQSFEVLSTANNHAFDRGREGVISTLNHFRNTSIMTVGSYENESDKNNLTIMEVNNIKIGFLAYTMSTNVKPSKEEQYMISYYKSPTSSKVTEEDYQNLKKDIEKLKKEVDVTIVLMHWGEEFTFKVNETQKELANFLNSQGVDIVVGSHAHNIQTMEWIQNENKTLVYYGMGNFVSADEDIPRTTEEFNNAYQVGLLSQVTIEKEKNEIKINNIKTEPIINYYDKNLRNFTLIPYHEYTENYETSHLRYNKNFNKKFIDNLYKTVIPEEFR